MMKKRNKKKIILISIVSFLLAIPLVILPILSVGVYESIFGERYETASWMQFSVEDYEELQMERSDFQSEDVTLAGYKYSKANQEVKGVVVIAHGLGGGGHNTYMPFVDYFTSNGYYVFAYDGRGNDNSGGDSVGGLPQGIIPWMMRSITQHPSKNIKTCRSLCLDTVGAATLSETCCICTPKLKQR